MIARTIVLFCVLAQAGFAWRFWGGIDIGHDFRAPLLNCSVLQLLGLALVAGEAWLLVVMERQWRAGAVVKAIVLGVLFSGAFALNGLADFGSMATVFDGHRAALTHQAEQFNQRRQLQRRERDEALDLVDQYRRQLSAAGMDRPVATLETELAAQNEFDRRWRAHYGHEALLPRNYADNRNRLESALATARALEEARTRAEALSQELLTADVAPASDHASFAALSRLTGASSGEVRERVALAFILLIKLLAALGFWATTLNAPRVKASLNTGQAGDVATVAKRVASDLLSRAVSRLMSPRLAAGLVACFAALGLGQGALPPRDQHWSPQGSDATTESHVAGDSKVSHAPKATSGTSRDNGRATAGRRGSDKARRRPGCRIDPAALDQAFARYVRGDNVSAITAEAGCSRQHFYKLLAKAGIATQRARAQGRRSR